MGGVFSRFALPKLAWEGECWENAPHKQKIGKPKEFAKDGESWRLKKGLWRSTSVALVQVKWVFLEWDSGPKIREDAPFYR